MKDKLIPIVLTAIVTGGAGFFGVVGTRLR